MAKGRFGDVPIEELDLLRYVVNPIDPALGFAEKVDSLVALSEANERRLGFLVRRLGAPSELSRKTADSIAAKATRPSIRAKKPWFNVEHIRDALRFRSRLREREDFAAAFAAFLADAMSIVKVDLDKMMTPDVWGWRFAGVDLRMRDGQLIEFYGAFDELITALEDGGCHRIYEEWRSKPASDRLTPAYQDAIEQSWSTYDRAWRRALRRLGMKKKGAELWWQSVRREFDR